MGAFFRCNFSLSLMTLYIDQFRQLDQSTKNYFYKLASKDGRRSGAQIFRDEVPECVRDCPHETQAFLDGDSNVGTEAHHASHVQSEANGGEFSNDNIVMERASDNLERGSNNMTAAEQTEAVSNSQADALAIDDHYTFDESSTVEAIVPQSSVESITEVATESIATAPTQTVFESLIDVAGDVVSVVAAVDTTRKIRKHCFKELNPTEDVICTVCTFVGTTVLYQNPIALTARAAWGLLRLTRRSRKSKRIKSVAVNCT